VVKPITPNLPTLEVPTEELALRDLSNSIDFRAKMREVALRAVEQENTDLLVAIARVVVAFGDPSVSVRNLAEAGQKGV
jgi:hypothetical protein